MVRKRQEKRKESLKDLEMPCWEPGLPSMPGFDQCLHYGLHSKQCWLDESPCPSLGRRIAQ